MSGTREITYLFLGVGLIKMVFSFVHHLTNSTPAELGSSKVYKLVD